MKMINDIANLCNDNGCDLKTFVNEVNKIIEESNLPNKTKLKKILFSGNTKRGISHGLQKIILGGFENGFEC